MIVYHSIDTPVDFITVIASRNALVRINFSSEVSAADHAYLERYFNMRELAHEPHHPVIESVVIQLLEYFGGSRRQFDIPVDARGTEFQMRVWRALMKIPYGKTVSYGQLAENLDSSARAVGSANGKNPVPIIIPCHRVIGADGTLHGFGGGLDKKQALLKLEGAVFSTVALQPTLELG